MGTPERPLRPGDEILYCRPAAPREITFRSDGKRVEYPDSGTIPAVTLTGEILYVTEHDVTFRPDGTGDEAKKTPWVVCGDYVTRIEVLLNNQ